MTFKQSTARDTVHCILCGSPDTYLIETLAAEKLVIDWLTIYGVDIAGELAGHREVSLHRCRSCDLYFFAPILVGSGELYANLETFDWYYMARKWEYEVALQDLREGERLLEAGCGRGDFIELARAGKTIDATGLELNPRAAEFAQQLSRPVYLQSIADVAAAQPGSFDAVCSFQVLEHVEDPRKFIGNCVELLKPRGRLLLSVPNNDGFLRFAKNDLLNQPPHHVTRWSKKVFESISALFPLELERVLYEPLADYHLDWYGNVQLGRLPYVRIASGIASRLLHGMILPVVKLTGWHRFLQGHTIYACYRKLDSSL